MNPSNSTIEAFANKVKLASRSKAKDVRLSIEEATELSATLNEILSQQNTLLKTILDINKNVQNQEPIIMSGGKI